MTLQKQFFKTHDAVWVSNLGYIHKIWFIFEYLFIFDSVTSVLFFQYLMVAGEINDYQSDKITY